MKMVSPIAAFSTAALLASARGSLIVSSQNLPCVDVVAAAQEPAGDAYSACKFQRQSRAPSFLGFAEPDRDCREFARLYDMARHFASKSFSASDFCSTLKSYSPQAGRDRGPDNRLTDHDACVVEMREVLSSSEVSVAAESACRRIEDRSAKAPVACAELVASLVASRGEPLDATRVCDRLVTGSSNGTQGLDEKHFIYSCVQYAANLVADMPRHPEKSAAAVAEEVRSGCEAHMSADRRAFCSGYADLVRQRSTRSAITSFCFAEYAAVRSPSTTAAPASAAATSLAPLPSTSVLATAQQLASQPAQPSIPAPMAFHVMRAGQTSQQKACEDYFGGIQHLHLPHGEDVNIVQMDCPKHFSARPVTCERVAQQFAAGHLREACSLLSPAPAPKSSPNMTVICESVVLKVSAIGLGSAALEQATVEACVSEIAELPLAHQPSTAKVTAGCKFIGKRLSQAQSAQQGTVDRAGFCSSLSSTKKKAQPKKAKDPSKLTVQDALALHAAAQQRPISVHAVSEGARGDGAVADQLVEPRPAADSAPFKKQVNLLKSAARSSAVEEQVHTAKPDASTSENTTDVRARVDSSPSGDFLSSFLDEYTAIESSKVDDDDTDDDDTYDAQIVASVVAKNATVASKPTTSGGIGAASKTAAPTHASNTSHFLETFLDQNSKAASLLQSEGADDLPSSIQPMANSQEGSLDSVLSSFVDDDA